MMQVRLFPELDEAAINAWLAANPDVEYVDLKVVPAVGATAASSPTTVLLYRQPKKPGERTPGFSG